MTGARINGHFTHDEATKSIAGFRECVLIEIDALIESLTEDRRRIANGGSEFSGNPELRLAQAREQITNLRLMVRLAKHTEKMEKKQ